MDQHTVKYQYKSAGQSLVEFLFIFPILLLILAAAFSIGLAMYQAHMASDAIRQPAMNKLDMASLSGPVCPPDLLAYANNSNLSGTLDVGPYLDDINVRDEDEYSSVLVGNKRIVPVAPFLPTLDIKVSQVINRNLLPPAYIEPGKQVQACGNGLSKLNTPNISTNNGNNIQPGKGNVNRPFSTSGPVTVRPANQPWVPFGSPNIPPWEQP